VGCELVIITCAPEERATSGMTCHRSICLPKDVVSWADGATFGDCRWITDNPEITCQYVRWPVRLQSPALLLSEASQLCKHRLPTPTFIDKNIRCPFLSRELLSHE
jgi:hypothetical protein